MTNHLAKFSYIFFAVSIFLFSCNPDKKETVITENYKGVFIVNEGGFLKSNGSVGLYKAGSGEYFDAFNKANGRPLGDVVQSMTLINDKYYIVVNNSNKIEVVNQSDFKSVTSISVNQPRSIIKVSDTKAYISQLNSTVMSVLDLTTNTVSKTIAINCATDNMVLMNAKVYVGKAYDAKLFLINTINDEVEDSITVGSGLGSLVNISSTKIGAFCLGTIDFSTGNTIENGKIAIINSDTAKVANSIPLTAAGYGGTMIYNAGYLYYTFGDGKLFKTTSSAASGAATAFISIAGGIYGLNADPSDGNIFITDAGNFNSAGKVYIYNSNGDLQKEFMAGIAPGKIVFNY